ncbi:B-cell receptor CD22-like [Clarias gariepinus]|uniref:B-cell receptor CD22-like n=1 Tax=Clarias gariepinus TaxID=13013 RepID=UPI00234E3427|nr:B-cell receptor CD22-like [Clarias gariepinus]
MTEGDSVTLICEVTDSSTGWTFSWYKDVPYRYSDWYSGYEVELLSDSSRGSRGSYTISPATRNHTGVYMCSAERDGQQVQTDRSDSQPLWITDPVNITVHERPRPVLSVSPQSWLTEGDSVTLICEVTDSYTDWTFNWYIEVSYRDSDGDIRYKVELLSDSSRGSRGSYTISPATRNHTGVYICRGERDRQQVQTDHSNSQLLWITGESPPVSLIINPSRTQHFTGQSLSLSCEDQRDSTGWTVRRYTHSGGVSDCSHSWWGSVTGSTCNISSLSTYYTGVYWCESESGKKSNPVNITVYDGDVILETPVLPVTEGHPLTLRCLYHNTKPSNLRADFYKDGSVLQKQTTGEMIIHKVSKSDEGFYHCKYSQRGESPKRWVSVKGSAPSSVLMLISSVVTASPYLLVTIILLIKCYRARERGPVLSVSPQSWLTEGDPVTLSCEVAYSYTDWTFSWYRDVPYRDVYVDITYELELLSDSSRGSRGSYTISPAALKHTGVYMCSAERDGLQVQTDLSLPQPLWIIGESPPVSLIINPNRTQHFTGDSLTLSCEDQSNFTG